jgi:adenine-specific DNA-methyltransferase
MPKYEEYTREQLLEEIKKLEKQKKFGLVWEDKPEDVVEQCKTNFPVLQEIPKRAIKFSSINGGVDAEGGRGDSQPTHLIIEGDNYHALSVLNVTHKGKIDVIYIDPPYNTGAKNWKYNNDYVDSEDRFRHSKWLSMMKKRLELAKNLLTETGVLICAIDENEHAHLCVMLEEMFSCEIHTITIVHNPRGVQGKNFSYTHEYAVFVIPHGIKSIGNRKIEEKDISWSNFRNWGSESERSDAKNCFYPVIVENGEIIGFGDVCDENFHPNQTERFDNQYYVYPIDNGEVERKWRYARQSVDEIKHLLKAEKKRGQSNYEIKIGKDFGIYKTVWIDTRYDANEYGTKLINKLVPNSDFPFPKSLYNVYDCIYAVVANNKSATILDFFAGSGTTGHAVLELNKEDGGTRQFILCSNNENEICEEVTYPRIKKVIEGYEEVMGISANVRYFKTDFVPNCGLDNVSDDDRINLTLKAGAMLALKENIFEQKELNDWWQIFETEEKMLAIYFKESKVKINELIAKLNSPPKLEGWTPKADGVVKKCVLYIFGWGKNEYAEEYGASNIEIKDIPEPILKIYRQINSITN